MKDFYKKYFETDKTNVKKISLDALKALKERGITTEKFLDYLCQKHGKLLHGSIHKILDNKLRSSLHKIFTSNKSAIAIMRSLYSNENVNLKYPYFISEKKPLVLKIHTPPNGKFIKTAKGFIYVVDNTGFKNEPKDSWQFIKETDAVEFDAIIETESDDFKYPVESFNDLEK